MRASAAATVSGMPRAALLAEGTGLAALGMSGMPQTLLVAASTGLVELDLSCAMLGKCEAYLLGDLLCRNASVKRLDLSMNPLASVDLRTGAGDYDPAGALHLLAALSNHPTVASVSFYCCFLRRGTVAAVGDMLRALLLGSQLRSVNLQFNEFDDEDKRALLGVVEGSRIRILV